MMNHSTLLIFSFMTRLYQMTSDMTSEVIHWYPLTT